MREKPLGRFLLIEGQCWQRRHSNRLRWAREHWKTAKKKCAEIGVELTRECEGLERWSFAKNYREFASWTPYDAHFIAGEKHLHLHDVLSVLEAVRLCLSLGA